MMKAVILHTVKDVEHCLKHGLHKGAKLFSANVHVIYYLKYHCSLECEDLCSYVDAEEYSSIQKTTLQACKLLLSELDQQVAPSLNQGLGLSIKYFEPLYALTGAWQLSLYVLLMRCLTQMMRRCQWDTILVYDGTLGLLNSRIESFLTRMFPDDSFQVVSYKTFSQAANLSICNNDVNDIAEVLQQYDGSEFLKSLLKRQGAAGENVLVFAPVNMLNCLVQGSDKDNVYVFNPWLPLSVNTPKYELGYHILPSTACLNSIRSAKEDIKEALSLVYETVRDDFCQNIVQYLQIVHAFKRLHEELSFRAVYWEVPPRQSIGALLIEYFMANRFTKVFSVQSQNTFYIGQTTYPYVFEHIFSRCHYFITQGAKQDNMTALYPEFPQNVAIVPPETVPETESNNTSNSKDRPVVDVALYLDWTSSYYQTGLIPMDVGIQEGLLNLLEAQQNKLIHVVTRNNPTNQTCAMLAKLQLLKNVIWVKDANINDYLQKYAPKVIVLSSLISILGEILPEDVNIVMMKNSPYAFDDRVLEVLKKRVYFVEQLDEVELLLQKSFAGTLEDKRDTEYSLKFCNREGLLETLSS
jgi:hypothetical protein